MKKYIILVIISCCYFYQLEAQRNVFWLEGINQSGNNLWGGTTLPGSSNARFGDYFENNFQINSHWGDYPDNNGILNAANDANTSIFSNSGVTFSNTNTDNVAIGLSLGGMVLRHLDANSTASNRRFGGAITIDSPLDGAFIGRSAGNGQVRAAANDAARQLIRPFQTSGIWQLAAIVNNSAPFFGQTPLIAGSVTVGDFTEGVFQLGNGMLDNLLTLGATERDLAGLTGYITGAQNMTPNINHIVNIWGDEQNPACYRIWTTAATEQEDQLAPGGLANIATNGITARNTAASVYYIGSAISMTIALTSLNPRTRAFGVVNSITWGNAGHYVTNRADKIYKELIGATRTQTVQVCIPVWWCPLPVYLGCRIFNSVSECEDWCTTEVCFNVNVRIDEESDAYIPGSSQRGENSAWGGDDVRIDGLNHMEAWFQEELRKNITDIFKGEHPDLNPVNNQYFDTPE